MIYVILTSVQLIIMDRRIKKIERIIQESLDNSWRDFGKLTLFDE